MFTNIRYIVLAASRDMLFIGLFLGLLVAAALSATLGGTAMVEKAEMTITFSAAASRVILMIGLIVFISFHLRHAFDHKEIDMLASRPLTRFEIVISYWLGFSFVAFLLVLATVTIMSFLPVVDITGFWVWSVSLLLESWLVVAAALFAAFTLRSGVSSVLATMGLYVLGRMMGFFLATSESSMLFREVWLNNMLEWSLKIIAIVMPRLDLFGQSEWLVYGISRIADVKLATLQAAIYIPLLIIATTIDFMRKEF